jgi:hypothetical protein
VSIARPRPGIASSWLDCRRTHLCRGQRPRETRSATVIASTATRDCGSGPTRELSDWVSSSDRAFEPLCRIQPGRTFRHGFIPSQAVHRSTRPPSTRHGAPAVITAHPPSSPSTARITPNRCGVATTGAARQQQVRRGNNRCGAATTGAARQQQVRRGNNRCGVAARGVGRPPGPRSAPGRCTPAGSNHPVSWAILVQHSPPPGVPVLRSSIGRASDC